MPPKPTSMMTDGLQFYNIDFSLQNQLRLAGAVVPNSIQPSQGKFCSLCIISNQNILSIIIDNWNWSRNNCFTFTF